MKLVSIAAGVVAVLAAAATGLFFLVTDPPIVQPIAFNHSLHVADMGMECTDCHLYAVNGVRATIPNVQVCGDCHSEAMGESSEELRVVEHVQAGEPIPWGKVYLLPQHVYFSHRRHAGAGELECERCHGPMKERVEPVTSPLVTLSMDGCMDCHEEEGISNDCLLCHR